ncbi:MAG: hypothetical protein KDA52_06950, partial [Planctomycetaceae bacterium]|nr:hypothetical protein [Planctomycetaceae bacterium]
MHRLPLLILGALGVLAVPTLAAEFTSDWQRQPDRIWIGPQYWANPMEDWHLRDGRLECIEGNYNANVHVLSHRISGNDGDLRLSVVIGLQTDSNGPGTAGFHFGIHSQLGDHRSSLLRGEGIRFAVSSDGSIQATDKNQSWSGFGIDRNEDVAAALQSQGVRLELSISPHEDRSLARGRVIDVETGQQIAPDVELILKTQDLGGNLSLVHNALPRRGNMPANQARFWFRDLKVSGTKLVETPEHAFGPILYAMHTLSRGVMTMTAQMPPIGPDDDQTVELQVPVDVAQQILRVPNVATLTEISNLKSEISDPDAQPSWTTIARSTIDPLSRTAHFRLPHWLDTEDVPYRLVYSMRESTPAAQSSRGAGRTATDHFYTGTVRKDPVDKPSISVAGFTGHKDTAFPNELLVSNVLKHDPDVLLFTGDQIYEDAGGFGIVRGDADRGTLNYLRKIYLWGWSFRDVLKDRPSFVLPDDHDVYQGNVWGQGGSATKEGMKDHDSGGFAEPADFVNAVFRTQCAHHPPAYDPTPMMQGIDCWYGDAVYGRISFAIIEDRYFKSGPGGKVNDWPGRPDHVKDLNYDVSKLDKPGLVLLGERQLDFLEAWSQDWRGADMKCVCSQTIFCNLANYHGPEQEFIYADLDSNGWPQ